MGEDFTNPTHRKPSLSLIPCTPPPPSNFANPLGNFRAYLGNVLGEKSSLDFLYFEKNPRLGEKQKIGKDVTNPTNLSKIISFIDSLVSTSPIEFGKPIEGISCTAKES